MGIKSLTHKNISRKNPSFFLMMSLLGLAAVLIGFSTTFFIPLKNGTFSAPRPVHLHGMFAFAWIFLFVAQTSLIHFEKYHIHQVLGILGIFIALGVTITMVPVGLFAVHKEIKQGFGLTGYSGLLGVISSGIMFLSFVLAGIYNRKKPEAHKRFMLLATIVVLWPAWFRFRHFFPNVPNPEIWFALVLADSLIIISWIWDKYKNGRIHPVLLYYGSFIILEQTFEVLAFDSKPWRNVALCVYDFLV